MQTQRRMTAFSPHLCTQVEKYNAKIAEFNEKKARFEEGGAC